MLVRFWLAGGASLARYAEVALADPDLDARAEQNRCYDDGGCVAFA